MRFTTGPAEPDDLFGAWARRLLLEARRRAEDEEQDLVDRHAEAAPHERMAQLVGQDRGEEERRHEAARTTRRAIGGAASPRRARR